MKNIINVYQTPSTSFFQNLMRGFSFTLKRGWLLWRTRSDAPDGPEARPPSTETPCTFSQEQCLAVVNSR